MQKGLIISILLHAALVASAVWSKKMQLLIAGKQRNQLQPMEAKLVDRTYKPDFVDMRKGTQKKDLPPPKVKPKKAKEPEMVLPSNKKLSKAEREKELKKSILQKLKDEAGDDERPPPKDDNFPMDKDGNEKTRGTGGFGQRALTPAEQALQSAMRRYFEFPSAEQFRKDNPDAQGYIAVRVVGVGRKLQIASLEITLASGFTILDRSCEVAIRRALENESFAEDIIAELNAKETEIVCQP